MTTNYILKLKRKQTYVYMYKSALERLAIKAELMSVEGKNINDLIEASREEFANEVSVAAARAVKQLAVVRVDEDARVLAHGETVRLGLRAAVPPVHVHLAAVRPVILSRLPSSVRPRQPEVIWRQTHMKHCLRA
jgi:hypothetical protein